MKNFVAMVILVVMAISAMGAFAETNVTYNVYTYDNGMYLKESNVFINDDGNEERDYIIGEHWVIRFITSYGSYYADWYAEADGEVVFYREGYDSRSECDNAELGETVQSIFELYYGGFSVEAMMDAYFH